MEVPNLLSLGKADDQAWGGEGGEGAGGEPKARKIWCMDSYVERNPGEFL